MTYQDTNKKESTFISDYKNLVNSIETITKNREGFGYNYADLLVVYDEVKPKINQCNFVLVQTVKRGDGCIRRSSSFVPVAKDKAGNITASSSVNWEMPVYNLHSELIHESGQVISCDVPLVVDDIDPQAMGSSLTYMRRYSLYVLLGITTNDDDDDGLKGSAKGKFNKDYGKKPLPDTYEEMGNFLMGCEDATKYYGDVKNHKTLTADQKQKLIKIIYPK